MTRPKGFAVLRPPVTALQPAHIRSVCADFPRNGAMVCFVFLLDGE
jgi:hypothetical protein